MSRPLIRKSQSSNIIGLTYDLQEESKRNPLTTTDAEAPPKDNNERVERLLTKLENASKTTNMEEMTRELRYLEEFDLQSAAYNEDQIKRLFSVSDVEELFCRCIWMNL